jgi:hypothetical protein
MGLLHQIALGLGLGSRLSVARPFISWLDLIFGGLPWRHVDRKSVACSPRPCRKTLRIRGLEIASHWLGILVPRLDCSTPRRGFIDCCDYRSVNWGSPGSKSLRASRPANNPWLSAPITVRRYSGFTESMDFSNEIPTSAIGDGNAFSLSSGKCRLLK